jgi:phytoene dehydrogenase-like protein
VSSRYDAVIIGSGIGGLTCAAFLARAGMRVCVLEQHSKIGGYAHSFKRRGYTFESGIHSVPMAQGSIIRHLLTLLGVNDAIRTIELPEMFHMETPGFTFTMPSRRSEIIAALQERFPQQKQNIQRLFEDYKRFHHHIVEPIFNYEKRFVEEDREFAAQFHNLSYEQYLSRFITDPLCRSAFYGQWPYGGASPDYGPALFYVMMYMLHVTDGSHSLAGGFETLATALASVITSHGGAVLTRQRVAGLSMEGKQVVAAVTANGDSIEADLFISNVGPSILHHELIPAANRSKLWQRRLSNLAPSISAMAVYCGLKTPAADIIPHNTNFWFASLDNQAIFQKIRHNDHAALEHLICLRNSESRDPATLMILYFLNQSVSTNWKQDKSAFAQRMLDKAEELHPGLKSVIDCSEVGSPDTFERYTGNSGGALYGFENTKELYGEAKLPVNTHVANLFQTGHWGKPGCGILNVMYNGYYTYHMIMRDRPEITPRIGRPPEQTPGLAADPVVAPAEKSTKPTLIKGSPVSHTIKLRLIYPKFRKFLEGHEELNVVLKHYLVGNYTMPPSLALPIIAALTPPDIEVNLTDDNIGQPIDFDERVDLAVVSCFTPQAARAYAIADEFRKRGTKVIIGGIHPTAMPAEAALHADAVCVGEVEPVWAEVIADLRAGSLKPLYQGQGTFSLADFPIPRRDIFNREIYKWNAHLVLTTRGCPVRCACCPIPHKEGALLRLRPVEKIIEDIKQMPYREFYFTDDTVMLPGKKSQKYLLKIMEETAKLDVSIFIASTMMMVPDPEFYRKLKAGGASSMYTVFGFDRISKQLFDKSCTKAEWQQGIDLVRMNEDAGIHFFASIGIGFDEQEPGVVDRILRFCEDSRIDLAEFYIPVPFPGTPFGDLCEKEDRILHRNYDNWNQGNIVFKPRHFTEMQLRDAFHQLWRGFYEGKDHGQTIRSFDVT